ncbi:MAG: hypothetical protein ACKOJF_21775, partial [Planctomycetaceae bacterium]
MSPHPGKRIRRWPGCLRTAIRGTRCLANAVAFHQAAFAGFPFDLHVSTKGWLIMMTNFRITLLAMVM